VQADQAIFQRCLVKSHAANASELVYVSILGIAAYEKHAFRARLPPHGVKGAEGDNWSALPRLPTVERCHAQSARDCDQEGSRITRSVTCTEFPVLTALHAALPLCALQASG
jgi:hypothetical protein